MISKTFQSIHLSVHMRDGHQVELEQGEDNIYKAIELLGDRFDRELRKQKNRKIARRNKDALKNMELEEVEVAEAE